MITETSAVAFRQNLGDMLNQVHYRSDSIVINKDGSPLPRWWTRACLPAFAVFKTALTN